MDPESGTYTVLPPPRNSAVHIHPATMSAYNTLEVANTNKGGDSASDSKNENWDENLQNIPNAITVGDEDDQDARDCVLSVFVVSADRTSNLNSLLELERSVPTLMLARRSTVRSLRQATGKSGEEARTKLERRRRLEFERRTLIKKMEDNTKGFDAALEDLRQDRHIITADLKLAELKLLVLYQEYVLLLTFEGRDSALQQKQLRCQREKSDILSSLTDCQNKLDSKNDDIAEWTEKAALVLAELNSLVPESNPFCDILTKIFRKKIKRSHKGGEDQDEDEEEEEEDDQDDDDLDEEEVDDNCPMGCDVTLYEKVLDLREKRLDHEEYISETQKAIEDLKKTMERLKQREKQIDKDSRQTEAEIQQFHLQKQAALNQIEIVVPLRISQIFAFTCSGKISGPVDKELTSAEQYDIDKYKEELKNAAERVLVSQMSMRSHVLFRTGYVKIL